jgi:predicted CoA-binding protein
MTDYSDTYLKSILQRCKTVAIVGASTNPIRPSYFVARYLSLKGFKVIPVNPGAAGQMFFGQKIRASLQDIDERVDMVDVFRRSEAVPDIMAEALDTCPDMKAFWMQIGVECHQSAETLAQKGVDVVMNRCPKIEYQRLFGELRMGGFNTGIISSKL